jgi:hypothetical protein
MAVNGNGVTEHVTGLVVSVNDNGLRLADRDGWLNYSKYAVGIVAPTKGQTVTLTLDRAGFVRAVAPADGSEVTPMQQGAQNASSSQQRDRTITRLAVLKAAAEFGAARPQLKSGEILAIAASWERWVNREQECTLENVDAF